MSQHWEATTLRLTAKQARTLWHLVEDRADVAAIAKAYGGKRTGLGTLRAILRKLEGGK